MKVYIQRLTYRPHGEKGHDMAKINDFRTSHPKRANAAYTWAWEVIVQEYNDHCDEYQDNIVARFFDPWKAVQYGVNRYGGMCMVQTVLLHTDNLTEG